MIEGHCDTRPAELRALARRPAPTAEDDRVRAALTDGHLSLFNLSAHALTTRVEIPQQGPELLVFEGEQTVTEDGLDYTAHLDATTAQLLAPDSPSPRSQDTHCREDCGSG
ncbi:hypothetical protein NKH77_00490 [Streptomyces sp. M19]